VTKLILSGKEYRIKDRAERHDFISSPILLFSSLLKKEGTRKGESIAKIVIKSYAFHLDQDQEVKLLLKNLLQIYPQLRNSYAAF
jgi:hypothetical protein